MPEVLQSSISCAAQNIMSLNILCTQDSSSSFPISKGPVWGPNNRTAAFLVGAPFGWKLACLPENTVYHGRCKYQQYVVLQPFLLHILLLVLLLIRTFSSRYENTQGYNLYPSSIINSTGVFQYTYLGYHSTCTESGLVAGAGKEATQRASLAHAHDERWLH